MEARAEYLGRAERPRLTVVKDASGMSGYSALPRSVLFDNAISPGARLFYAALQTYWWKSGECFASHATLAADFAISERQVQRYLAELVGAGHIVERPYGRGQGKAYAPAQPDTNVVLEAPNTTDMSPLAPEETANTTDMSPQRDISVAPNTTDMSSPYKKKSFKKKLEEELHPTGVDGGAGAPPATATVDQAKILRGLSDGAREILDWHRQCHGRRQPAKLNPESARVLEDAVADLGVERLKESVRYMAGKIPAVPELSKAIRAARTKRTQDESGSRPNGNYRNGADPKPPTRDIAAAWAGWKGRHGSNLDDLRGRGDGR
jgi:hypothetical protein